jgi:hypothetical protein
LLARPRALLLFHGNLLHPMVVASLKATVSIWKMF